MRGLMMESQLLVSSLLTFAARYHGETEVVSRTVEGPIHRYTYAAAHARACKLANALRRLGMAPGDRIGTLAWNGYRHFEVYYAVSGSGAVVHTINPRLFPDQIAYIINHAEDAYVFADLTFVPLLEKLADRLTGLRGFVVMTDEANMPAGTSLRGAVAYEALIADEPEAFDWPTFDENTACGLCYTSGTTGRPKGVLYSHRSTVLHSYATNLPDVFGLSARDVVMPVVPMFHVNAWGIPYCAPMAGAKLVFPGAAMDGPSLCELIEGEGVTHSAGVPTVWLGLLAHLKATGQRLDGMKRLVVGGAALPVSMVTAFREHGVPVVHGWGMTEISPVGAVNCPKSGAERLPEEERLALAAKQGRPFFGIEMRITDDEDRELPRDGATSGLLKVRGPWVCSAYYREEVGDSHDADGWLDTGDIATIDPAGYMHIIDRSKDLIRSGGEWISSIALENIAVGHPAVREAAVIAAAHPKWGERPLLVVVREDGAEVGRDELLAHYRGKVAGWWTPDDVVFVDELPHTATGKVQKSRLREALRDHVLPTAAAADSAPSSGG